MRVLIVSHSSSLENVGGAELTLLHAIAEWRRQRPDTEFLVLVQGAPGRLQALLDEREVAHESIVFDAWVMPQLHEAPLDALHFSEINSLAVQRLIHVMRDWHPDVVVTNTIIAPWAGVAAKHLAIPHVWMVHEYGDLDHGMFFALGRSRTFEDIGDLSDLVVANSVAVRDHIAQWIPMERLAVAYPPIDLERVRRKDSAVPTAPGAPLHVGMVGRIASSKGQWRLAEAMALLAAEGIRITATFVGDDSSTEATRLRDRFGHLGLGDDVRFTGERADPFSAMASFDVGVVASDCEAFGRVTVEYMALGKPVIAARTGASPELVTDGESGWLFDVDDSSALARALREASVDRAEVARRGQVASETVSAGLMDRHPLADVIPRIEDAVNAGSGGLRRLPHITRGWLEIPRHLNKAQEETKVRQMALSQTATWQVGARILAPFVGLRRRGR